MAELKSLHLGRVQEYNDAAGVRWHTAIAKVEVPGPVQLSLTGPVGDEVGDRKHHGGKQQAVMVYSRGHRNFWMETLGLDIAPGGLGENLSVEGLDEFDTCVGDRFEVGTALVQVSQPRQPCRTLSRYWNCEALLPTIWESARSGWYFRVLREGTVNPGDALHRVDRPHPSWTVARLLHLLKDQDPRECGLAAELEHLSPGWRERFQAFRARTTL